AHAADGEETARHTAGEVRGVYGRGENWPHAPDGRHATDTGPGTVWLREAAGVWHESAGEHAGPPEGPGAGRLCRGYGSEHTGWLRGAGCREDIEVRRPRFPYSPEQI